MTVNLDLADIQCNVLQPTALCNARQPVFFPRARYFTIHVPAEAAGRHARDFVMAYRSKVTTSVPWYQESSQPPKVAINLAFSWEGLLRLALPVRTLAEMPAEFIHGMANRARILGDPVEDDPARCKPKDWEKPWVGEKVHILVGLNAQIDPVTGAAVRDLQQETDFLLALCERHGLEVLPGHSGLGQAPGGNYQEATACIAQLPNGTWVPTRKEHFGFSDGIGQPVFEGQFGNNTLKEAQGRGKLTPNGTWEPLATGEFLLGHPDEAQEIPGAAMPAELIRNGTFLVYRKLHQNVKSFNDYIGKAATAYAAGRNLAVPDAREIIMAKMAGRWSDGVPISVKPTLAEWRAFQAQVPDPEARIELTRVFSFKDDPQGAKCPIGAHLRRVNTRDSLDTVRDLGSALNNRRRLLRRGLPYGEGKADDNSGHGVIVLVMCASIARQFEFVQQQWLQYGLDASAGNDDCPLLGTRGGGQSKFVIPVDPDGEDIPHICSALPNFVQSRGGEYFFVPSMTALRMIGMGVVDPT
jgi:Dyp-type peroxidase family